MANLDDIDRSLLEALRRNSRAAFTELAKRLDISEGTVRTRVRRMVAEGAIQQFTLKTAGAGLKALVNVSIDRNINTSEVSTRVAALPGVEQVYETAGDYDIAAIVDVGSTGELNEVIERVRTIGSTVSTETRLILKEVAVGES